MEIVVRPGKRKTEIVKEENGVLYVDVNGKAENNEANEEVVRYFSKKFGKDVKIIKGLKSKRKILRF